MSASFARAQTALRAAGAATLLLLAASAVGAVSVDRSPEVGEPTLPVVWNGDLRDLPQASPLADGSGPFVANDRLTPNEIEAMRHRFRGVPIGGPPAATEAPAPPPLSSFAGMSFAANGNGWPPDTNGDVGPNHYIQVVNTSVGIFDKATGSQIAAVSFNTFFPGPAGTPCDTANRGDPVALYDAQADRWLVTDFAWFNQATGPYYQCIAVSQTGDPVAGGWYFYALRADTAPLVGYLNDYPKLGVWPDAYYMSANMFGSAFAVRLWALDRASILSGGPLNEVHFDICEDGSCGSFLPANQRGPAPPANTPGFFMGAGAPDRMTLYRFDVDWVTPANSSLTGPIEVPVSPYSIYGGGVPQMSGSLLDSLSFRLMMQLQYRNYGTHEALFATHTIDVGGRATARWYEIRDPGGTPTLYQEGDHYLGDGRHRWMASIAADGDGDVALGYSVSSSSMHPAIRYAGRRSGETPGQLPQTEQVLIDGTGSQSGISRWGDYSAMSVDPVDDCTYWFTTEYYATTGSNWQTRIGSFRFPSCGQPKGVLAGSVIDSQTLVPIPGAPITVEGTETLSAVTDASGNYSLDVLPGTYDLSAGPVPPGYPGTVTITGRSVSAGNTTTTDLPLDPVPFLESGALDLDDSGAGGNGNGFPEPGESDLGLTVELVNVGAATSHGVSAVLSSSTPGVTISQNASAYPDIAAGAGVLGSTPFVFSLDAAVPCGTEISFHLSVSTDEGSFELDATLETGILRPRVTVLTDAFESGANGWTTGGVNNTWAQTTESSNSPTHSWTDSPGSSYLDNTNSYLVAPVIDLGGRDNVRVSASYTWDLEAGYDYVYLEYSLNGGTTWAGTPLATFNGTQGAWTPVDSDAPALDGQGNVRLRYRLDSDGGVVADGIHVDDFEISYQPTVCQYPALFRDGLETGDASQWSAVVP